MRQAALRKLQRAAERAIGKAELPGFVLWAARDGEVIYHEAFGEAQLRPHRRPMKTETVFDLASLTKVLSTTLLLMKLSARGAIDIVDPVTRFVPTFADRDEKKRDITLRHLLTHSSGLKAWVPYYDDIRARDKKRDTRLLGTIDARPYVLDRIAMSGLIHEVGEASVYGDLGFIVLAEVIERAAGTDPCALFAEEVARPLGLRNTGFIPLASGGERVAAPGGLALPKSRFAATEECPWRERVLVGEVDDGNAWAVGGVAGHAGLFGTAEEVGKIALALLASYEGQGDLIARPVIERFFTRQDLPPGSDWALGWDTPTEGLSTSGRFFSPRSVGHTGFTGTSLWMDLDRRIVVVLLANRVHPIARKSRFTFRPRVHDLLMEALGLVPRRKKAAPAPEKPAGEAPAEAASGGGAGSSGDPLP
jgi:CubicO group peptidase (beta-lactamase class C family)